ncbi:MAG TPA: SET domain-containing protein-lysine N-methyltransferase [Candidatus Paceibacterota bacterium]
MAKNNKNFTVKESMAGLGLFSNKSLKRGDFIIEYTGEKISSEEADRRGGKYLFTLNKKTVINAKARKNTARYINHSCRPNCYAEIDEDKNRINIYCKRKINKGEEITYNYGKEYWEDFIGKNCRCEKCNA